jgi:hypothetical protein
MSKKLYVVMKVTKSIGIEVLGREQTIDASWMKGQIGALPVFDTMESALEAGFDKEHIFMVQHKEEK